jgi:hypothetical protein
MEPLFRGSRGRPGQGSLCVAFGVGQRLGGASLGTSAHALLAYLYREVVSGDM